MRAVSCYSVGLVLVNDITFSLTESISFLSTPFTLDDATQFLKTCAQNMSVYMAAAVSKLIGLFH